MSTQLELSEQDKVRISTVIAKLGPVVIQNALDKLKPYAVVGRSLEDPDLTCTVEEVRAVQEG